MPTVTYVQTDGQIIKVEGKKGQTILQIALDNGVPMEHACGGNGFCTTCSCDVEDGQHQINVGALSPVNDKEENMGIEGPVRRLGCQTEVYDDTTVRISED